MSGGTFEYKQYVLNDIKEQLVEKLDKFDELEYNKYENELDVLALKDNILKTIELLTITQIHVHRLDWLFAGDDGLENYFKRIEEDFKQLK